MTVFELDTFTLTVDITIIVTDYCICSKDGCIEMSRVPKVLLIDDPVAHCEKFMQG